MDTTFIMFLIHSIMCMYTILVTIPPKLSTVVYSIITLWVFYFLIQHLLHMGQLTVAHKVKHILWIGWMCTNIYIYGLLIWGRGWGGKVGTISRVCQNGWNVWDAWRVHAVTMPCMNPPCIPHVPTVLTNTRYRAHFTHPLPHISSTHIYIYIYMFL